jgi:hypothetical protein
MYKVARLVLLAFVGPCPDGMECCHTNGNRTDNRLTNLRWDTPKANAADKRAHGTHPEGEGNGNHKLTEQDVRDMRREHRAGRLTYAEAGRRYRLTRSAAKKVIDGSLWSHIHG